MRWARTLILAHMLIKAVRENEAYGAAAVLPGPQLHELYKENPMNDDAMVTPTPTPAPTPDVTVPSAPLGQGPAEDVNTLLNNAAKLAQTLGDNPNVLIFMNALMAAAKRQT